jgi:hypothetical protein
MDVVVMVGVLNANIDELMNVSSRTQSGIAILCNPRAPAEFRFSKANLTSPV